MRSCTSTRRSRCWAAQKRRWKPCSGKQSARSGAGAPAPPALCGGGPEGRGGVWHGPGLLHVRVLLGAMPCRVQRHGAGAHQSILDLDAAEGVAVRRRPHQRQHLGQRRACRGRGARLSAGAREALERLAAAQGSPRRKKPRPAPGRSVHTTIRHAARCGHCSSDARPRQSSGAAGEVGVSSTTKPLSAPERPLPRELLSSCAPRPETCRHAAGRERRAFQTN